MQAFKWLGVELVEVSFQEKLVSAVGAALAIYLVFFITRTVLPPSSAIGVIASMGASAILLFAVPHGQLSQPWPLMGGHCISAVIGVICSQSISNPGVAVSIAVGVSIGVMLQLKCIHPPGGATAFTAVMGGSSIHELGFYFVFIPVAMNALAMLILAVAINYPFSWRRYPAALVVRQVESEISVVEVSDEEHRRVVEAIRSLDSFVDVSEEDLVYLARTVARLTQSQNHVPSERKADPLSVQLNKSITRRQ